MGLAMGLLRVPTAAKVVDSALLNRLGVQVLRAAVAHRIHDAREVPLRGAASDAQLATLDDEGVLAIEGFLPASTFAAVREAGLELLAQPEPTVHRHGRNRVLQHKVGADAGALDLLFDHPVVRDLFDWGERVKVDFARGLRAVEELRQGEEAGGDPETELHSDIFFPTHKAWLYLDDVTRASAPFVYVKGSHKMPVARLSYEYRDSCSGNLRSRRVSKAELERRDMVESAFEVPANTFVIANTCGYHRRLMGSPGARRRGVHMSHRRNPFLPRFGS